MPDFPDDQTLFGNKKTLLARIGDWNWIDVPCPVVWNGPKPDWNGLLRD